MKGNKLSTDGMGDVQVEIALKLSNMEGFTGRSEPTVIT
jgi:hypothetical protein